MSAAAIDWEAEFGFPFRTKAHANRREDWRVTMAKKKREKSALRTAWICANRPQPPATPVLITFTRIAPNKLDPQDNLPSAFKYMLDELCRCIGLTVGKGARQADDSGRNVRVLYRNERGGVREYAVRVKIESGPTTEERIEQIREVLS